MTRFWEKVDKHGPIASRKLGRCWLWIGGRSGKQNVGYFWDKEQGRVRAAHKFLWESIYGPVPDGLELDHLCRVPHCVRPSHLEPVSHRINVLRGASPAAQSARKDRCVHGHKFSEKNTYITSRGHRQCRTCKNERQKKYDGNKRRMVRC